MPTYQYRCKKCEHEFDQYQSFTDDPLTKCPECKGQLKKVFGSVGISFKGSGFYKNDSRGKTTSTTASTSSESSDSSSDSSTSDSGTSSSDSPASSTSDTKTEKKKVEPKKSESKKPAKAGTKD